MAKNILAGLAGAIVFFLVIALIVGGSTWLKAVTAPFFGWAEAERQIESAPSRIANYNHFFDLCAAVEGYEDQIVVLQDQLDETGPDDTREVNRLRSTISGIEGQRARAIRQYNADATKDYTQARFRDSDLPYQLSIEGVNDCHY